MFILAKQFFTNLQYWGHDDEYKHKAGRISGKEPLVKTLDQINKTSTSTNESEVCFSKILTDNNFSPTPRPCKLPCRDKMFDITKLDEGIPIEDR